LSKTACLGILRRAKVRGKELPKQLRIALEIQGEVEEGERESNDNITTEYKAYHINQRNEGIDLNGISGALMATQNMQMQTFVAEPMLCLNDQGGERMDITENITSTLRASMGGNQPIVIASQQDGSEICNDDYPNIPSATGISENNQPILFDNHGKDCRYNGPLDVAPTIAATYGTGGNNVPLVSQPIDSGSYCIAGNTIDRQDHNGGNGCGFQENISYTLTTSDIHAVCFPAKTYQNTVGALCVGDEKGNRNQYVSQDKCIVDNKNMIFGPLLIPMPNGETIPIIELSKTSANDATTETCFCDLHDNIAFAVIEKGAPDFDETSEEMKFIYAYKAFIFEYYKQKIAFNIFRDNFKENPSIFLSLDMVGMYRMLQLKEQEFKPIKSHFDEQIMAGTFEGVVTCAIKIPEQIRFAGYAYIAPDYDMNGKKIIHTVKGIMHRLAITIFPEVNQSWLLVSCLKSEQFIYDRLFQQLKTASLIKLKFYINLVLPLYSENMVLSTELWESWDDEVQMAYTYYANLKGKDAVVIGKGIGFGLKNAFRQKSDDAYYNSPKINLFV
jgi:hypothetical protein